MADPARQTPIGDHIRTIDTRTATDAASLLILLHAPCWPAGTLDRRDPVAVHWLKRWRPVRSAPVQLFCACAAGACTICN